FVTHRQQEHGMLARSVATSVVFGTLLLLPACVGSSSGQEEATPRWEYRAVRFDDDEKASTSKLNELARAGWEYVGPLGRGMVAFKRRLTLAPRQVRRIEWSENHIYYTAFSPDSKLYLGSGDSGTLRVWEVSTGRQVQELPLGFGLVSSD